MKYRRMQPITFSDGRHQYIFHWSMYQSSSFHLVAGTRKTSLHLPRESKTFLTAGTTSISDCANRQIYSLYSFKILCQFTSWYIVEAVATYKYTELPCTSFLENTFRLYSKSDRGVTKSYKRLLPEHVWVSTVTWEHFSCWTSPKDVQNLFGEP